MVKGVTLPELIGWISENGASMEDAKKHFGDRLLVGKDHKPDPKNVPPYTLEYTSMAKALIAAKWSIGGAEENIRGELAELAMGGCWLPDLMFHVVGINGASPFDGENLIVSVKQADPLIMLVDAEGEAETIEIGGIIGQIPTPYTS